MALKGGARPAPKGTASQRRDERGAGISGIPGEAGASTQTEAQPEFGKIDAQTKS
jgi:hypothetical protein